MSRRYLFCVLHQRTHLDAVVQVFRPQEFTSRCEPFDALVWQLDHECGSVHNAPDAKITPCLRELLLIVLHITRDTAVSEAFASRQDVLASLFQYLRLSSVIDVSQLVWQIIHNLVMQIEAADDLNDRLAAIHDHNHALSTTVPWSEPHTRSLAIAFTDSLVTVAKKSPSSHLTLLQYLPVLHALLFNGPWHPVARVEHEGDQPDTTTLENVAYLLALVMTAYGDDIDHFARVLVLTERVVVIGQFEVVDDMRATPSSPRQQSLWSNRVLNVMGHLVCALCDLLLSFHEAETRNSWLPGDETKRLDPPSGERAPPTTTRSPPVHGVYCRGYASTTPEFLGRILKIFTLACAPQLTRQASRHGSSRSNASELPGGNSILYVGEFYFHLANTQSGRLLCLNPTVIAFWSKYLTWPNAACSDWKKPSCAVYPRNTKRSTFSTVE